MGLPILKLWSETLTARRAVEDLRKIGHSDIMVFHGGCSCYLSDIVQQDRVYFQLASEVRISFYGGPPTKRQMYHGTIRTLWLDRMYCQLVGERSIEKLRELLGIPQAWPCA